jgi:hypothetical protein
MTAAWFAVGVCSGALFAACGGAPGQRSFTSAKEGVAISYPSIWKLTTRNDNYVPDPALCFDLVPKGSSRVDLRVVEYLPPYFNRRYLSTYQPRPRRFRLVSFRRGDEDWSPGKITSFHDHGRVFFVGVVLPAAQEQTLASTAERILDSLRVSAHGKCRPTSGVGSHGVPNP